MGQFQATLEQMMPSRWHLTFRVSSRRRQVRTACGSGRVTAKGKVRRAKKQSSPLFLSSLQQQVEFDLQSFQRAAGRVLNPEEQERFRSIQLQALRWTYLGS